MKMFEVMTYKMNADQLIVVDDAIILKLDCLDGDVNEEYTEMMVLKGICNAGIGICETLSRNGRTSLFNMPITDLLFEALSVSKELLYDKLYDERIDDKVSSDLVEKLLVLTDLVARLDK